MTTRTRAVMALPVVIVLLPLGMVATVFHALAYLMLMFYAAIGIASEALRRWVFEKGDT